MNFSIIIPIYNESKNIVSLINEIIFNLDDLNFPYEIILIDDCSTDDLRENLLRNNLLNKITLHRNNTNKGQSFSLYFGITKSKYENIISIDGDGQNDPADIPKLIEIYTNFNNYYLVGGIREKRKDSIIKILSSKIANYIRSKILNDNCLDTGCSLKVFKKKVFLNFDFFDGIHRFLPALYSGSGYDTFFINVNHRRRLHGLSKYGTLKRLIHGIRDMIKVKIMINKIKNQ